MSSDLYVFDASFHRHSSSDIVSSDGGEDLLFSSESFPFPFLTTPPTPIGVSQEIQTQQNPLDETPSLDSLSPSFFSFSPPSRHLESLTLYQANHVEPQHLPLPNGPNLESEFGKFSVLDELELKSEECQMGVDYNYSHQFAPHSYSSAGNISKFMQRSFSGKSFGGKAGFFCQPHYETVMDSPDFQSLTLSSGENSFFSGQMRRVCSTGDLQNIKAINTSHMDGSFLEEANFKVGRYSAEERKERISKYRAKRSQRNFNKTIKYACRKTLADNRPRIRGRFARNDETSETHKAPCSTRDEDEDEFWIEEQDQDITVRAEEYVDSYGGPQFQYCGY